MKKLFCLILSLILIFSTSVASFADVTNAPKVEQVDDYYLFSWVNTNQKIVILTDESASVINVSIIYMDSPDITYQWVISDQAFSSFDASDASSYYAIINYAEHHTEDAKEIMFIKETSECSTKDTPKRNSSIADLKSQMEDLLPTGEYSGALRTDPPISINGVDLRVYETVGYFVSEVGSIRWNTTITLASLILNVIGATTTSGIVKAICTALDCSMGLADYLLPGKLKEYLCTCNDIKYVTANNIQNHIFNTTEKNIYFTAYEDATQNSVGRACIDVDSRLVEYSDSVTYFYSHSQQAQDGYNAYIDWLF